MQNNFWNIIEKKCHDLDKQYEDVLRNERFMLPRGRLYLAGHSLGPEPKQLRENISIFLTDWADKGVEGHFQAERPWADYHKRVAQSLADLCGALPSEVVAMGSLTANLHLALAGFYTMGNVAMESGAFSSDVYAVSSFLNFKDTGGQYVFLPGGRHDWIYENEELENWLLENKPSMVLLSAVQYKTGQVFNLEYWSNLKKKLGFILGLDLAHAIGNVSLSLHQHEVDFAVWCSYKYLSSGPGGIGGLFIHEKHHAKLPALQGWWGHRRTDRFAMEHQFYPEAGADAWQLSNPPIVALVCLETALEIYQSTNLELLFAKTQQMQQCFRTFWHALELDKKYNLVTQTTTGAMNTLYVPDALALAEKLRELSCEVDTRGKHYLRFSFHPLYHTFADMIAFLQKIYHIA